MGHPVCYTVSIHCTIFGYDLYICMVVTKQCGCDAVHNDIVQYNEVCNTEWHSVYNLICNAI